LGNGSDWRKLSDAVERRPQIRRLFHEWHSPRILDQLYRRGFGRFGRVEAVRIRIERPAGFREGRRGGEIAGAENDLIRPAFACRKQLSLGASGRRGEIQRNRWRCRSSRNFRWLGGNTGSRSPLE